LTPDQRKINKGREVCIVVIDPKPKRKLKPKPKPEPLPGSKYMVSRKTYRLLPEEHKRRIDYFREDVMGGLSTRRQRSIRQAFVDSSLDKLLTPEIPPLRVYAFFDDVGMAIRNKARITPKYLNSQFTSVRDAESLTTVIPWEPKPVKWELTDAIKEEVREWRRAGAGLAFWHGTNCTYSRTFRSFH